MPGHLPNLDPAALLRLRHLVKEMHRGNGRGVPMNQLVRLAQNVPLESGLTIDFGASRELGQPMVVLRVAADSGESPCLEGLSPREREVAALITEGLSNKQIAQCLFISLATVKDHVHHILQKTELPSRSAVAAAVSGHRPQDPNASESAPSGH